MIITTTETVAGREIAETLGLARGNVIKARNVGADIVASVRNLVGGEVTEYTKLMSVSREEALERMVAHAQEMRADAVVCMRFSTSMITDGAAEILAYGTAVKLT
ncbi:MAG: YbjQ family protein [Stappiaceae bacterium]